MKPLDIAGKRVLVVGAARSGLAASEFLLRMGADVTLTDRRKNRELGPPVNRLRRQGVTLALGGHPPELFRDRDLIVVSPGIPRDCPGLVLAQSLGIEILGELELAARFIRAPIIAVTGTNGKSTTTSFIGHILRAAQRRVFVGGNLGTPLSRAIDRDLDVVVAEVSSFQLEWAPCFDAEIAVLLNITPDHMERYDGLEDYARTKARLIRQQSAGHAAVVNVSDPMTLRFASESAADIYTFGHGAEVKRGIKHVEGRLWMGETGKWSPIPIQAFRLRGRHNIDNLMAALMAAHLAGVDIETLCDLVPRLEGLPHRLEYVREVKGVRYYNDSKATNVSSVATALGDFDESVILLMGGRDKGESFAPLEAPIRRAVKLAVVYGESAEKIRRMIGGWTEVRAVSTLHEAIDLAGSLAVPGDSVLLSPACASFDQFQDFEARGEAFRRAVWTLAGRSEHPAEVEE